MPSKKDPAEQPTYKATDTVALKNTSPLGDVDVPSLGLSLKAGEVFEVDGLTANVLLAQCENYQTSSKSPTETKD